MELSELVIVSGIISKVLCLGSLDGLNSKLSGDGKFYVQDLKGR